jgi:ribosome-associated heat shock protein Hsp15
LAGASGKTQPGIRPKQRLDKWLFFARFFKSRNLAADAVEAGYLRLNGQRCMKSAHGLGLGDVLTFAHSGRIRVIRVTDLGQRRGAAADARQMYLDLEPGAPSALE